MANFIRAKLAEQDLWVTLNMDNVEYYVAASKGTFCRTKSNGLSLAASQEEIDAFLDGKIESKNVTSLCPIPESPKVTAAVEQAKQLLEKLDK